VSVRLDDGKDVPMAATPETELWSKWRAIVDTTEVLDGPHKLVLAPFTEQESWNYEFAVMVSNR
jgi:hypothetical protein